MQKRDGDAAGQPEQDGRVRRGVRRDTGAEAVQRRLRQVPQLLLNDTVRKMACLIKVDVFGR